MRVPLEAALTGTGLKGYLFELVERGKTNKRGFELYRVQAVCAHAFSMSCL